MTWLCAAALATWCAVVAAVPSSEAPYGHLLIGGSATLHEYFRATFGGHAPCGVYHATVADDGVAFPRDALDVSWSESTRVGCEPYSPAQAERIRGGYVFAWRGNCSFVTKALHAQAAGAVGLVVVNHVAGTSRTCTQWAQCVLCVCAVQRVCACAACT